MMNSTTKKLLIFGGIVAVIIIFIALKKKQDEELPQLGDIAGGKGPAVRPVQPLTWSDAQIVIFGNGNQDSESGHGTAEEKTFTPIGLVPANMVHYDYGNPTSEFPQKDNKNRENRLIKVS